MRFSSQYNFNLRVFHPLQFTGQHSSRMNTLKMKVAFFMWTFLSLTRFQIYVHVSSDARQRFVWEKINMYNILSKTKKITK